jgi:beta-glucanase (GH16 family)
LVAHDSMTVPRPVTGLPDPTPPTSGTGPRRPRRRPSILAFVLTMALTAAVSIVGTAFVLREPDPGEWVAVYHEDFQTDSPAGQFPGTGYPSRFTVYPDGWSDTSGRGRYAPSKVLSVANGTLRWDMHTENGVPLGAAVVPTLPTYGQTYGRYSVRFRADPVPGFGLAFLLWPDSEKWPRDGEIDFPEGELNGEITAAAHHAVEAGTVDRFRAAATFADWHIATTEWRPGEVTFLLDGNVIGRSTTSVPARSMHWVLQTGSDGTALPDPSARARIEVDWIEAQARR